MTQAVRKRLVAGCRAPWHLRFRLQESGVFQPLWWLDSSRVRAVLNFERWNRVKRHSHSQGYVLIAAISGSGPMMLMTRVRL
jgi:hypothetical protein